jgi:peptidyl-prolyl cis-trans isomerase C
MKRTLMTLLAMAAAPVMAQNVATVNGKAIPNAKLEAAVQQYVAQSHQPDSPELRAAIKKELISREVLLQEALKQGVGMRPEVQSELDRARTQIMINMMMRDFLKKNAVTDAEIQKEYDTAKAAQSGKEYRARHILVETEKEATDLIAKLKGGAKFEELAKGTKDTGSAANGGDLGWSAPGSYVPEFSQAMVALKPGEMTQAPVKSQFGYHIIRLEEVRDAQFPSLEEVKDQVAEAVKQRKLITFRDNLINKAVVK